MVGLFRYHDGLRQKDQVLPAPVWRDSWFGSRPPFIIENLLIDPRVDDHSCEVLAGVRKVNHFATLVSGLLPPNSVLLKNILFSPENGHGQPSFMKGSGTIAVPRYFALEEFSSLVAS